MLKPLMRKVVAIWLIDNTSLTFKQIADFCGLHLLEVEALADEENKNSGLSPLLTGELTEEEIKRCEMDPNAKLEYKKDVFTLHYKENKLSQSKFKKQNKPEAILWLLQNYPSLSNYQIGKLLSATPTVVKAIREKTHWNYNTLRPKNPIGLGYTTEEKVVKALDRINKKSSSN